MITTELHNGQGFGNQLWCYVVARVLARDRGVGFGIGHHERFKGSDFMDIDFGQPISGIRGSYEERSIVHPVTGADIRTYDPLLVAVPDGTKISGYMQDERYIEHRKDEIREWLRVKPEVDCRDYSDDSTCVINFRGGGYRFDVDFFLAKRYWRDAVRHMRAINPRFRFIVVTDDPRTAKRFFPEFEVHHWSIGKDYAVIKNARYLIVSNSSFAFFPAWLSTDLKLCIAPKYWGRHNVSDGYWSLGYNIVRDWKYLDRRGRLSGYDQCTNELERYMSEHADLYSGTLSHVPSLSNSVKSAVAAFGALRRDIGLFGAFAWVARTRALRSAIYLKDEAHKAMMDLNKNARRIVKKILRTRERIPELIAEMRARQSWMSPAKIAEYRKNIKIYDAFTFFNELDLLEIRLGMLDPYVDRFVISESVETFSGDLKPLHFAENRERFKKWEHKIVYQAVTGVPKDAADAKRRLESGSANDPIELDILAGALTSDLVDTSKSHWVKEYYIKESLRKALSGLSDDDFCYISDLDEIWDPKLIIDYSKDDVFKLRQTPYMYFLNNRSDEDWREWTGTIAAKYGTIKGKSLSSLRRYGKTKHLVLRNGGWHFNFLGGAEGARRKLIESNHPWYKPETALLGIEAAVRRNVDHRGKNVKLWVSERALPSYIVANKERYRRFFR